MYNCCKRKKGHSNNIPAITPINYNKNDISGDINKKIDNKDKNRYKDEKEKTGKFSLNEKEMKTNLKINNLSEKKQIYGKEIKNGINSKTNSLEVKELDKKEKQNNKDAKDNGNKNKEIDKDIKKNTIQKVTTKEKTEKNDGIKHKNFEENEIKEIHEVICKDNLQKDIEKEKAEKSKEDRVKTEFEKNNKNDNKNEEKINENIDDKMNYGGKGKKADNIHKDRKTDKNFNDQTKDEYENINHNKNISKNYIDYDYNFYDYGFKNYGLSIRLKGVIGLRNLGNTCFMNSSLQCLSHIEPLYNKIKHEKNLGKLGLSFQKLLVKMFDNSEDKYFSPKDILDVMSSNYEKYKERRQQGANEFISNFLKTLHEELNSSEYKEKIFVEPSDKILLKKFLNKKKFYEKNKSFIIDLFYGNIIYLTCCKECDNFISALYSIYNILELSIYERRKEKNIYLEELIKDFSSKKESECKLHCKNCNKEVSSDSQILIANSPDILIIYINKVIDHIYYDNNIIFPNKLDLNIIIKEGNKKQDYNLIGIIEHNGSESFGHYTSKCYNFKNNNWYSFNDNFVDNTIIPDFNDDYSKSREVMLLFYQRNYFK